MKTAWISLSPEDLRARLFETERAALARATDDQAELILADVLSGIEQTIRGYIRARRDVVMSPRGIPPSLRDTALDLAVPAYSARAAGVLLDPKGVRAAARDAALKRLEDVAAGRYAVEEPEDPESTPGSATPLPAIKVPPSILCIAFALLMQSLCSQAATPLRWDAETSRPAPADWPVWQGETLALTPRLLSYGSPLDLSTSTATLYWQAPGMDSTWWSAPATISTQAAGRVTALWTPAMDSGAPRYAYFIAVADSEQSTTYRAYGTLMMRASPGAVPNELPLPVPYIDFDLVEVRNAPWATPTDLNAATGSLATVAHSGSYLDLSNTPPPPEPPDLTPYLRKDTANLVAPGFKIHSRVFEEGMIFDDAIEITPESIWIGTVNDVEEVYSWLHSRGLTLRDTSPGAGKTVVYGSKNIMVSSDNGPWRNYWLPNRDANDTLATQGDISDAIAAVNWPSLDIATNILWTVTVSNGHWLITGAPAP